ncbi:MAG: hypothetical protein DI531_04310 [Brevundimonas sp.]|nr:MAG: hypothetical protein DI531_04310 [Brevundimonas sp.]
MSAPEGVGRTATGGGVSAGFGAGLGAGLEAGFGAAVGAGVAGTAARRRGETGSGAGRAGR